MMTVIISFQQANERLLGPSSHVVEVAGCKESTLVPSVAGLGGRQALTVSAPGVTEATQAGVCVQCYYHRQVSARILFLEC